MDLVLAALVGLALGLVLGLLGGGGGILAVPLLVHVLGQPLDEASTTSLVVVAIGAGSALIPHARAGRVDWRAGLTFGLVGSVGAIVGSRGALLLDDRVQLGLFIALIVVAGIAMLRSASRRARAERVAVAAGGPGGASGPAQPAEDDAPVEASWGRLVAAATGVGLITGLFGVGGGFVAVPALVFALHMPMRRASATALVVIVVNSLIAYAARFGTHIDAPLTLTIGLFTAAAAVAGALVSPRFSAVSLQRAFGVLILLVAAWETYALVTGG